MSDSPGRMVAYHCATPLGSGLAAVGAMLEPSATVARRASNQRSAAS